MSGELTPEDREFLREHKAMVDRFLAGAMAAGQKIGPISFEALLPPVSTDHAFLARAARLVKKIVDAAQPRCE